MGKINYQAAIEKLYAAQAVEMLGFFVVQAPNRGPELNCRIWDGFKYMSRDDVEKLCKELNEAMRSVQLKWESRMEHGANNALTGGE